MIAAIQYTVHTVVGELIGNKSAAITENAAVHVQLDMLTNVDLLKCSAFLFVSRFRNAMFVAEILKITFTSLVADRAIERVIDQ
jgi:hypothetical protein